MKILVVGSGGREHALVHKISQSKLVDKIYCAPGNAGIATLAECVDVKVNEIKKMADFAEQNAIDLTVVAPDDPLVLGMVDEFEKRNLRAFGPRANAAIIEGSKVFSKDFMKRHNIPTATYEVFETKEAALSFLKETSFPTVIKADGLALGKGVIIVNDYDEAVLAIKTIMEDKAFGESGNRVVVEEFLTGPEISVLAFSDGKTVVPMVSAQDHKRIFDGDKGPNTGGMGAFSPSRIYDEKMAEECMQKIFAPTVLGMAKDGRPFKGVLYFGLMSTPNGVKVIEYNCRFGDPETQAVLPRLKSDLVEIMLAVIDEKLDEIKIEWSNDAAVCIVMASGGYPSSYNTGFEITGLENVDGATVFHAGTKTIERKLVTAGGRVLGVTALAPTLDDAIKKSYKEISKISFEGMHYRKDIGIK